MRCLIVAFADLCQRFHDERRFHGREQRTFQAPLRRVLCEVSAYENLESAITLDCAACYAPTFSGELAESTPLRFAPKILSDRRKLIEKFAARLIGVAMSGRGGEVNAKNALGLSTGKRPKGAASYPFGKRCQFGRVVLQFPEALFHMVRRQE